MQVSNQYMKKTCTSTAEKDVKTRPACPAQKGCSEKYQNRKLLIEKVGKIGIQHANKLTFE